ncbi:MAG: hypothetical protein JWR42_1274, partial [Marmoricola sp.]|nr:hypothetical protein [Marmoricola sp.]
LTEKVGRGEFTLADEAVVVALASAAGVVIENARLHEEAGRRESWLAATADVIGLLTVSVPLDQALHAVAESARAAADADVAWIVTGPAQDLVVSAFSGAEVTLADLAAVPLTGTFSHHVVATGSAVSVPDLLALGDRGAGVEGLPVLGSAIIVPLRSREVVVGALALAWTPERGHRFREVDPRLPASFAEQAGLALQMVQAHDAEQRVARLEERDRIGRDLHDLVIQRLFAVGLGLQAVSRSTSDPLTGEHLEGVVDDLDATIRDIRRSIFALETPGDSADLQSEVTRLVERAAATMKFRPTLRFEGPVRTMVSDDQAPHLLAVLGEALSNAARHADAGSIRVAIIAGEDLRLVVDDDGRGLPADVRESGLRHMRERAALLGGTCQVESSGAGTTVTWAVPWVSGVSGAGGG